MLDKHWQAAAEAVQSVSTPSDVVLCPRGDWPFLGCDMIQYQGRIDLRTATLLVLHKAHLPAIDARDLAEVYSSWNCIFADEVFAIFCRQRKGVDIRGADAERHIDVIRNFLAARINRELPFRIWYIHLPKTGGTSLWAALSQRLRSSVYIPDQAMLIESRPNLLDFDAVGGHFPLSRVAHLVEENDLVVSLVRKPSDRLVSAYRHSRRELNRGSLVPGMEELERRGLLGFPDTPDGRVECALQSLMLGAPYHLGPEPEVCDAAVASAIALARTPRGIIAPLDRMADVHRLLSAFVPGLPEPGRLNEGASEGVDEDEVRQLEALLRRDRPWDINLYDEVTRIFEAKVRRT